VLIIQLDKGTEDKPELVDVCIGITQGELETMRGEGKSISLSPDITGLNSSLEIFLAPDNQGLVGEFDALAKRYAMPEHVRAEITHQLRAVLRFADDRGKAISIRVPLDVRPEPVDPRVH
jgi:hypothetical protein